MELDQFAVSVIWAGVNCKPVVGENTQWAAVIAQKSLSIDALHVPSGLLKVSSANFSRSSALIGGVLVTSGS